MCRTYRPSLAPGLKRCRKIGGARSGLSPGTGARLSLERPYYLAGNPAAVEPAALGLDPLTVYVAFHPSRVEGIISGNRRKRRSGLWITPRHRFSRRSLSLQSPEPGGPLPFTERCPHERPQQLDVNVFGRNVESGRARCFKNSISAERVCEDCVGEPDFYTSPVTLESRRAGIVPHRLLSARRLRSERRPFLPPVFPHSRRSPDSKSCRGLVGYRLIGELKPRPATAAVYVLFIDFALPVLIM